MSADINSQDERRNPSPERLEALRKRLKRFLGDQKIELEERHRIPLLVAGGEILWLLGQRRSGLALPSAQGGPILRLELI